MIASGYEAQCWLRQHVTKNLGSYAYISDPVDAAELRWLASTLLWESARPYLYLRGTGDGGCWSVVKTTTATSRHAGIGWSTAR
ncbi:hypothetical protein [Halomonas heilongjiangensis]|uniref:hypothetical protein n=1 Tax=Halomonas heilongjiangensis TaxID=1387883 RepID=UPI0015E87F7C|nr:hypothetical protein [Halomonas heilongjiangensis]